MPTYNVFYFMVKPTYVPSQEGSSGSSGTMSQTSEAANRTRQRVLTGFEAGLRDLMQRATAYIPGPHATWDVRVTRIPESSPGVPNFTGLTIQPQDPIVYLVTRHVDRSAAAQAAPTDRRASLVMYQAIGTNFEELPSPWARDARESVRSYSGDESGMGIHVGDYVPATAEVFADLRMSYDATNWEEIQINTLANVAFHEIAHCRAECTNRATGNRWQSAITGSIHDHPGATILGPRVGQEDPSTADLQLMGRHMMCPIRFYRLDQPIANQFFTRNQSVQLTPHR